MRDEFKAGSFFLSLSFLIIFIFLLRESLKINTLGIEWGGPRFFPLILTLLLISLSSVLVVIEGIKFFKLITSNRDYRNFSIKWEGIISVILVLLASIIYILVIKVIGYFITTFILSFIVSLMFKARVIDALLVATIITLSTLFLFKVLLSVPLPEGVFGW